MAQGKAFDRLSLMQAFHELGRRAHAAGKRRLAREIGIGSAQEALDLLAAFYPDRVIEPRIRFGLEEIFDRLHHGDEAGDRSP